MTHNYILRTLESNEFELEGHKLVVLDNGFTDTEYSTSLYVPSIGLVVAGDAVYNGIHPYMPETTEQSRLNWIAALDRIEGLKPHAVVAGHKNPAYDDNPQHIEATRVQFSNISIYIQIVLKTCVKRWYHYRYNYRDGGVTRQKQVLVVSRSAHTRQVR